MSNKSTRPGLCGVTGAQGASQLRPRGGLFRALLSDERGQDLAEYGIALAVIVGAVAVLAGAIGNNVNSLWTNAQTDLAVVVAGS